MFFHEVNMVSFSINFLIFYALLSVVFVINLRRDLFNIFEKIKNVRNGIETGIYGLYKSLVTLILCHAITT